MIEVIQRDIRDLLAFTWGCVVFQVAVIRLASPWLMLGAIVQLIIYAFTAGVEFGIVGGL